MAEPICASCGKPRKGHNYRHPFISSVGSVSVLEGPEHTKKAFVTVKVPLTARKIADKLVLKAASVGWKGLGSDRTDPVNLSAIFEEGVKLLLAKAEQTK